MANYYGEGIESMVRRRVKRVALTAGNANAFAFAWQNPEDKKIVVTKLVVDVTTAGGTATSVLDVARVAGATDTGDTIIDGADLNAVSEYDNLGDPGTNGTSKAYKLDAKDGTNDYITGKILVANAASLAGYVYIEYFIVED